MVMHMDIGYKLGSILVLPMIPDGDLAELGKVSTPFAVDTADISIGVKEQLGGHGKLLKSAHRVDAKTFNRLLFGDRPDYTILLD